MGSIEAVLTFFVLLAGAAVIAAVIDDRTTEPSDEHDAVVRAAHDRIDDYELERVRSMLRRR